MRRVAFILLVLAGCGEIAGITDLTSDEKPDAGMVTPVVDAGPDVVVEDVVEAAPAVDATEADKGFRRVFVTSVTWDGLQIGGLSGADAKCADVARSTGLDANGEKWIAWLSGPGAAKDRLTFDGPYRLLNGTEIAADKARLSSGTLRHAIDVNEQNGAPMGELRVWTGTEANGNISGSTCGGWMNDTVLGLFGKVDTSGSGWTQSGTTACGIALRLYCFEK